MDRHISRKLRWKSSQNANRNHTWEHGGGGGSVPHSNKRRRDSLLCSTILTLALKSRDLGTSPRLGQKLPFFERTGNKFQRPLMLAPTLSVGPFLEPNLVRGQIHEPSKRAASDRQSERRPLVLRYQSIVGVADGPNSYQGGHFLLRSMPYFGPLHRDPLHCSAAIKCTMCTNLISQTQDLAWQHANHIVLQHGIPDTVSRQGPVLLTAAGKCARMLSGTYLYLSYPLTRTRHIYRLGPFLFPFQPFPL